MNPAEQTVTWLITLGVLESPKKTISDPDGFLQSSLKDGVVLCRLLERLRPGTTDKVSAHPPFGAPCFSVHFTCNLHSTHAWIYVIAQVANIVYIL